MKKIIALISVLCVMFAFGTVGVLAVEQTIHYDKLVNDIFDVINQQKTTTKLKYEGEKIDNETLRLAISDAIESNIKNLFLVNKCIATLEGNNITISIEYNKKNTFPVAYAAKTDDVAAIISRSISNKEKGVNIFIELDGQTLDAMKGVAQKAYEQANRQSGDDYNKILLAIVNYTVSKNDIVKNGYFLSYEFLYTESKSQTEQVNDYVTNYIKMNGLEIDPPNVQVTKVNAFIKEKLIYLNTSVSENYSAYGALKNDGAVCQGYALLADAFFKELGIPSRIISGVSTDPVSGTKGSHVWNGVKINNEWLHVDTTWNDAYADRNPYLLIKTDDILKDHTFDQKEFSVENLQNGVADYQKKKNSIIKLTINKPTMQVGNRIVSVDGDRGTTPIIREGRTLLPIRNLIEQMGGKVEWNEKNEEITIKYNNYTLTLWINANSVIVNGRKMIFDSKPIIVNGRTMVPVRLVSEMLGMGVEWEEKTSTVTILPY